MIEKDDFLAPFWEFQKLFLNLQKDVFDKLNHRKMEYPDYHHFVKDLPKYLREYEGKMIHTLIRKYPVYSYYQKQVPIVYNLFDEQYFYVPPEPATRFLLLRNDDWILLIEDQFFTILDRTQSPRDGESILKIVEFAFWRDRTFCAPIRMFTTGSLSYTIPDDNPWIKTECEYRVFPVPLSALTVLSMLRSALFLVGLDEQTAAIYRLIQPCLSFRRKLSLDYHPSILEELQEETSEETMITPTQQCFACWDTYVQYSLAFSRYIFNHYSENICVTLPDTLE